MQLLNLPAKSTRLLCCLDRVLSQIVGDNEVRAVGRRLCRKKDLSTGNPSQFLFATGQFQKVETPTLLRLAHRLCQHLELALYGSCSWPQTL